MRSWAKRSKEAAYLFNPAFCCATLAATIVSYQQEAGLGLPFPLAFIAIPVLLHKQTRNALPFNTRTSLAAWLEEHPFAKVQFYERAISVKPFVREAILFGIRDNKLHFQSGTLLSSISNGKVKAFLQKTEGEARECIMRARLLGKWFALAGSPETVMGLWEIQP